jgi:hypothetical protein
MRHPQDPQLVPPRFAAPPPALPAPAEIIEDGLDVDVDLESDDADLTRQSWSSVPRLAAPPPVCPIRDRRRSYRHEVCLPIEVSIGGATLSTHTRLISLGGALVASELRPAFGALIALRLDLPTYVRPIEASGVVRWSDAHGFGVQFDGLRAHAVWALGKYFARR